MTAELSDEVAGRLSADEYGWLTTVSKAGLPIPRLIWFYFDGTHLVVYSAPGAAKVRHVRNHAQVSLNLDSDGNGGGVVVIGGTATIGAEGVDCREDEAYWEKFGALADQFGLTDAMGSYSTKLRIAIDKVWGTPEA